jgi:hypothetical protein
MTQTITLREGRANVFVAVEHANCVSNEMWAFSLPKRPQE